MAGYCRALTHRPRQDRRTYLVWHELEFREGYSFTYAVYDSANQYLGCCYLGPMGRRTPLTETLLEYDVDVSWWVTPDAYARGFYTKLYNALRRWVADAFPFKKAYYSNSEIPDVRDADGRPPS